MSEQVLRPGSRLGNYPEQRDPPPELLPFLARRMRHLFAIGPSIGSAAFRRFLEHVEDHEQQLKEMDATALGGEAHRLRQALHRKGLDNGLAAQGFALVREQAWRTMSLRHHNVQLFGGWLMLHGRLAEMETGEGKTLTATLPAAAAALAGIPVHVIIANDYLARRDAEQITPLYATLGLSVGVVDDTTRKPEERRAAWACDITYCTAQQVAFDYLRDGLEGRDHLPFGESHSLLRGLCYAIVDEADSVLIDEARTLLVIAREIPPPHPPETYNDALQLASSLNADTDYLVDHARRSVEITSAGEQRIGERVAPLESIWQRPRRRRELVRQALTALHLYQRDRDYLVRDGRVEIIDANTGRTMADCSWEMGLHQMIEAREGCTITPPRKTLARISYQSFFRRYLRLAGMTGTAREVAAELHHVYGLRVVQVPPHRPSRRRLLCCRVLPTREKQMQTLIHRLHQLQDDGRPVLIGTRTVAFSEKIQQELIAAGLPHHLLNARQDAHEAEIIASAGKTGRITIVTNMAGRGTDILLGPGIAERGGLHVILMECNEARRINRQLFGRCGCQEEPGSYETLISDEYQAAPPREVPQKKEQPAERQPEPVHSPNEKPGSPPTKVAVPLTAQCLSIGPVTSSATARKLTIALSEYDAHIEQHRKKGDRRTPTRYLLLTPQLDNAASARRLADDIRSATGIKDIAPITHGSMKNRVSLGAYTNENWARERLEKILKAGFKASLMPQYNGRSHIWLDVELPRNHPLSGIERRLRRVAAGVQIAPRVFKTPSIADAAHTTSTTKKIIR
ncbi:MAG TPA: prepilin peptidase [Chromatiales bacterium]|nr:prepilin peptidase [Chromatiales bacterium]